MVTHVSLVPGHPRPLRTGRQSLLIKTKVTVPTKRAEKWTGDEAKVPQTQTYCFKGSGCGMTILFQIWIPKGRWSILGRGVLIIIDGSLKQLLRLVQKIVQLIRNFDISSRLSTPHSPRLINPPKTDLLLNTNKHRVLKL